MRFLENDKAELEYDDKFMAFRLNLLIGLPISASGGITMSLSAINSNAPGVADVAPQKAPAPKAPAEPVATAPVGDTVSLSAAAQKLQSVDVDRDGDSH